DSISASHPLSFKIEKASEVYEAFDSISYDKGASILKMMALIIGENKTFEAVAHYIKKFAYSNAEAADLWEALDEVVGGIKGPDGNMKVSDYADQWTSQMSFPMVTVDRVDATQVRLTQKRYLKTPKAKDPKEYRNPKYGFKWDLPIWYQIGNGEEKFAWLKRGQIHRLFAVFISSCLVIYPRDSLPAHRGLGGTSECRTAKYSEGLFSNGVSQAKKEFDVFGFSDAQLRVGHPRLATAWLTQP
ncbi:unnamed protein product, partial [Strongylus vulgaris]